MAKQMGESGAESAFSDAARSLDVFGAAAIGRAGRFSAMWLNWMALEWSQSVRDGFAFARCESPTELVEAQMTAMAARIEAYRERAEELGEFVRRSLEVDSAPAAEAEVRRAAEIAEALRACEPGGAPNGAAAAPAATAPKTARKDPAAKAAA